MQAEAMQLPVQLETTCEPKRRTANEAPGIADVFVAAAAGRRWSGATIWNAGAMGC